MSFTTPFNGRLCNQVIRNLAVSFVAAKSDLKVSYSSLPPSKKYKREYKFQ